MAEVAPPGNTSMYIVAAGALGLIMAYGMRGDKDTPETPETPPTPPTTGGNWKLPDLPTVAPNVNQTVVTQKDIDNETDPQSDYVGGDEVDFGLPAPRCTKCSDGVYRCIASDLKSVHNWRDAAGNLRHTDTGTKWVIVDSNRQAGDLADPSYVDYADDAEQRIGWWMRGYGTCDNVDQQIPNPVIHQIQTTPQVTQQAQVTHNVVLDQAVGQMLDTYFAMQRNCSKVSTGVYDCPAGAVEFREADPNKGFRIQTRATGTEPIAEVDLGGLPMYVTQYN